MTSPFSADDVVGLGGTNAESRGCRRPSVDRGLPDREALLSLGGTFLEIQRKLWPAIAKSGLLPKPSPSVLDRLADEFTTNFRNGTVDPWSDDSHTVEAEIGQCYLRYSDDNSNPRSLDQQLRNILEKARRDGIFIPWTYVFADAAITGTIASRRGYSLAKRIIIGSNYQVRRLYIDEIGRASRNAIEALRLGRLVEVSGRRFIGVSDGFDSQNPQSKMLLMMYAMLQEWFVDQLRAKVNRGMRDAFLRGKNINGPSFGYKLIHAIDPEGNPIVDDHGDAVMTKAIASHEAERVLWAFRQYAVAKQSTQVIARTFNEQLVGGRNTWTRKQIFDLLQRELYIGVEYYGKTTATSDPDTGKYSKRQNDRKEWLRRDMPHLRIIEDDLWKATQKRLKECADAYARKPKNLRPRTEVYPTVLLRPYCKSCDVPLRLGRSGKFASFYCSKCNKSKNKGGLGTYKSVKVVEELVLDHVRQVVLDESFLERLVNAANTAIEREARRPQKNEEPLVERIKSIREEISRWMKGMEESCTNATSIVRRVSELEQEANEIDRELSTIRATKSATICKLTANDAKEMLADLRGLLREDVASAAPLLRRLIGKITVENSGKKARKGSIWIARFSINTVPVLAELAARRDCPNASTLEILDRRDWTMPVGCAVELRKVTKAEKMAQEILRLHQKGASVTKIARALNKSFEFVSQSLHFAKTGEYIFRKRHPLPKGQKPSDKVARPAMYKDLAGKVTHLRDVLGMSFKRIAHELGVHFRTVERAWYLTHQTEIMDGILSQQPATGPSQESLSPEDQQCAGQRAQDGPIDRTDP